MVLLFERKDGSLFALSDVSDFLIFPNGVEITLLDSSIRFIFSSLASFVSGSL